MSSISSKQAAQKPSDPKPIAAPSTDAATSELKAKLEAAKLRAMQLEEDNAALNAELSKGIATKDSPKELFKPDVPRRSYRVSVVGPRGEAYPSAVISGVPDESEAIRQFRVTYNCDDSALTFRAYRVEE